MSKYNINNINVTKLIYKIIFLSNVIFISMMMSLIFLSTNFNNLYQYVYISILSDFSYDTVPGGANKSYSKNNKIDDYIREIYIKNALNSHDEYQNKEKSHVSIECSVIKIDNFNDKLIILDNTESSGIRYLTYQSSLNNNDTLRCTIDKAVTFINFIINSLHILFLGCLFMSLTLYILLNIYFYNNLHIAIKINNFIKNNILKISINNNSIKSSSSNLIVSIEDRLSSIHKYILNSKIKMISIAKSALLPETKEQLNISINEYNERFNNDSESVACDVNNSYLYLYLLSIFTCMNAFLSIICFLMYPTYFILCLSPIFLMPFLFVIIPLISKSFINRILKLQIESYHIIYIFIAYTFCIISVFMIEGLINILINMIFINALSFLIFTKLIFIKSKNVCIFQICIAYLLSLSTAGLLIYFCLNDELLFIIFIILIILLLSYMAISTSKIGIQVLNKSNYGYDQFIDSCKSISSIELFGIYYIFRYILFISMSCLLIIWLLKSSLNNIVTCIYVYSNLLIYYIIFSIVLIFIINKYKEWQKYAYTMISKNKNYNSKNYKRYSLMCNAIISSIILLISLYNFYRAYYEYTDFNSSFNDYVLPLIIFSIIFYYKKINEEIAYMNIYINNIAFSICNIAIFISCIFVDINDINIIFYIPFLSIIIYLCVKSIYREI